MSVLTERRDGDFFAQAEPYRRELLAHCYRMTGSLHDAEDLVQETYLRAWKAYDRFEGKSSVRTWLHRIATNTCLTALEGRQRRPLPSGLGAPSSDPTAELVERTEIAWLEPLPEFAADPSDIVGSRESVRLAFIAALQHLSPGSGRCCCCVTCCSGRPQRWPRRSAPAPPPSTACCSGPAPSWRPRAQPRRAIGGAGFGGSPGSVGRYIAAFEAYDVDRLVELFTSEAVWEMPPYVGWYQGPQTIATLIRQQCPAQAAGDMRLIPLLANGQPAAAMYMRDGDRHLPFQLQVLDITEAGVSHVVAFLDTMLFPKFGLPASL
ncbi:RNA polymerase sigma factor, sigma-70 family protein [Mycobacterium xenopi 4042]|uniref:RNA polymerase sigma factor n=1 Tax=Mycobacterium xenopi 4042 TaxID=1299334 RepID=X8BKF6_MYCXE|nr:RNA polymerase sigma factor, sigma-70 family protein [Mycobacterium xenopi 4042]